MTAVFSRVPIVQKPNECGPTSLASCLCLLGIDKKPDDVIRAAGLSKKHVRDDGCNEFRLQRAAERLGTNARFLVEMKKQNSHLFLKQLLRHLGRSLPAMIHLPERGPHDVGHWVAVITFDEQKRKFVIMDPADEELTFNLWSERTLMQKLWCEFVDPEDEAPEPPQYFAILISRRGGKTRWMPTAGFLRLCERGAADTADGMLRDMQEVAWRASTGMVGAGPSLHTLLRQHEDRVVDAVDHWSAEAAASRVELRQLYRDYIIVANAASVRLRRKVDEPALVAQMATILAAYRWVGDL